MRTVHALSALISGLLAAILWISAPLMPTPLFGWLSLWIAVLLALGAAVCAFLTVFGEDR